MEIYGDGDEVQSEEKKQRETKPKKKTHPQVFEIDTRRGDVTLMEAGVLFAFFLFSDNVRFS